MIGRPSEAGLRRGETAAWCLHPRTRAPQWPRMRLVSRKSIAKRNLRGFATVELPIGLKLVEGAVFGRHEWCPGEHACKATTR